MRTGRLKSFLWILPFFLAGFLPARASGPERAPSGATEASRPASGPEDWPAGGEEREILARMELLENLELLENMDLFEDFFLVIKEDED